MFKKFIICAIVACSALSQTQQGTSSPYSFYGIGSLKFKGTVENQSMGGLSVYTVDCQYFWIEVYNQRMKNLSFYNNEARPVKYAMEQVFRQQNSKQIRLQTKPKTHQWTT
jgi:hypothetical protein